MLPKDDFLTPLSSLIDSTPGPWCYINIYVYSRRKSIHLVWYRVCNITVTLNSACNCESDQGFFKKVLENNYGLTCGMIANLVTDEQHEET